MQTAQQFLELFWNNLVDVGVDPAPYRTHSFRHGGCQYLHCVLQRSLQEICEWGGWSTEFTHLTIIKYLISANDEPSMAREDFLNPNHAPTIACHACGRTCHCGY